MSLVEFVIDKLDDLKGTEIVHFDVKGKSSITENMIICTGTSSRQVSAMADNLIAECKKAGYEITAGAKHDKAIHKETGKMIAIPRHKGDIPVGTAHNILKAAGLK